jgi:DNA repair exonuclease SbcCD nuclease subunit
MKLLLITDQHFGVRNDNQHFIKKYQQFYSEIVLPQIDKQGITHILCLGDTFDKRKSINFNSLDAAKEMWFQPLADRGIQMTMLCGNHDIYYRNTLKVNAPSLLLGEYDNIDIIESPVEKDFDGTKMLLLPWICDGNREQATNLLQNTDAKICMGHLELNGFEAVPGHLMEHGDDPSPFEKFDLVCSGHFHMKSRKNHINYLGNPYQLFWNDYKQRRGFHILNTDTVDLKFFQNTYNIFNKVYYNDSIYLSDTDLQKLEGSFVKLVVESKEDQVKFDKVVRLLQSANLADLKIIEDLSYDLEEVNNDIEIEDTLSILETCVSEFDNKDQIYGILKSLYVEALEV